MKKQILRMLPLVAIMAALPFGAVASSHREAPLITHFPTLDNTDVYAFRSPDRPDTVTLIANYIPIQEPGMAPNYYQFFPGGLYEIHIDNDGDAVEDVTYQFRFRTDVRNGNTFLYNTGPVTSLDDADLNVRQFYQVTRVNGDRRRGDSNTIGGAEFQVAPYNIGPKSTPNYAALAEDAIGDLPDGGRVFAGPRDDPFFVDIAAIGDLLTLRPIQQLNQVEPVRASAPGIDTLQGYNVHTIALQLPMSALTSNGQTPTDPASSSSIIGVWATSSQSRVTIATGGLGRLRRSLGPTTQVSRLGMPLVNEVVIPLAFKDIFNASEPSGDFPLFQANETFRNRILDPELATLITALYGVSTPPAPRDDLVTVFLTGIPGLNQPSGVVPADMLRLNLAVPVTDDDDVDNLGVIAGDNGGFPNGRRLSDDVVDIALRVVAGGYILTPDFNREPNNMLTDGANENDREFMSTFPYVALPHQGFDHEHHPAAAND